MWDSQSFKQVCEIPGQDAAFRASDGMLAVLNTEGNKISYFDIENCSASHSITVSSFSEPQQMTFTVDGKYLMFIRQGFQIFDGDNGELVFKDKSKISTFLNKMKISPDGKYLLSTHADNGPVTALWKIDYGQLP